MSSDINSFARSTYRLARNPLGIIALFIVLVYGFASLVTAFDTDFTPIERLPLIYFLVLFPVLVLAAFLWLVSKHSEKLYGPGDYRDESNYLKIQAAANLGAAAAKTQGMVTHVDMKRIADWLIDADSPRPRNHESWRTQILWVDDRPENNIYERQAFKAMGMHFTLAKSTNEAIQELAQGRFAVIISDMGRREGPREGYVLLDKLRQDGDSTPFLHLRILE